MPVRQWHGGKLVLLWGVVICTFLLTRAAESDVMTVVLLLLAAFTVVATWRWLSARAVHGTHTPGDASANPPSISAKSDPTTEGQVARLYRLTKALDRKSESLVASMLAATQIPASKFQMEILALQVQAAHYAIFAAHGSDAPTLQRLLDGLYDLIRRESGVAKHGDELVDFVRERGKGYVGALGVMQSNEAMSWLPIGSHMLPFNGLPPHDVGLLFAFYCGTRDPIVCAFGGTVFVSAEQAASSALT